jgi:hypothetical protein
MAAVGFQWTEATDSTGGVPSKSSLCVAIAHKKLSAAAAEIRPMVEMLRMKILLGTICSCSKRSTMKYIGLQSMHLSASFAT